MLDSQRKKIDRIDSELIDLLQERMKVVNEIMEIKLKNNIPVLDKTREEKQMNKIATALKDSPYKESVSAVFASILEISKEYQEKKLNIH